MSDQLTVLFGDQGKLGNVIFACTKLIDKVLFIAAGYFCRLKCDFNQIKYLIKIIF